MRVAIVGVAAVLLLAGCETMSRTDLVATPRTCAATTLPIYFAEGEAGLTDPARQLIQSTAETMRGCSIARVRVIGLASSTGSAAANQTLSERRAANVAEALAAAGLPAPGFEVEAAGEGGAVQGGVAEPVRRRVEVIIEPTG